MRLTSLAVLFRGLLAGLLVGLLVGLLAGLLAGQDAAPSKPPRPNILLIVADDLGWNDVGYHNREMRTPHLDALCKAGVRLDWHYVQPQCTPTRVALMTGRYPSRFGEHCTTASNAQAFPIGTPTLASVLKQAGYATGMSGKWHLGSKFEWGPKHHGFESSHGSLAGAVGMYDHRYRLDSPFSRTWHRDHQWLEEEGHVTDLTAKEAVRFITAHKDGDRPWFFFVPFHAVHTPLVEKDPRWHERNKHIEHEHRRLYAAAVSHMDAAIGRMVAALEKTGQRERTLILFTSDNGAQVNHRGGAYPPPDPNLQDFSSNEPLRGKKTDTFEGGYRVPALASWPGTLATRTCSQPMHCSDWLPTLARLAGARLPDLAEGHSYDGEDVWPQLSGAAKTRQREFYINWGSGRRLALRHNSLKLVRNRRQGKWMVFDLATDPRETKDLAQAQPDTLAFLKQRLAAQQEKDAMK